MKNHIGAFLLSLIACGTLMAVSKPVHAASIYIPKGYTNTRVRKAHQNTISKSEYQKLVTASIKGMKYSNYYDTNKKDQETVVNPTKLTKAQNKEMSKFALSTINSARVKLHHTKWIYDTRAEHTAKRIANYYYKDNMSCWDSDHDYHAIKLGAKNSGLNYTLGNVYEDEAGLPITSKWPNTLRSMASLKEQTYFNIKQMLFGGFYGSNYNDRSRYTEYNHASDLLSLDNYASKKRMFGVAYSTLKSDPSKVSVHFIGIPHEYVLNYKKFNK